MEINPQRLILPDSPTSVIEPTFTYILSWPPDQYRRGKIQIISCYGDTTDTGWTTGGYATTSMPGRGHHRFEFINQRWYYDSRLGWGWYYDSNPNIERKVLVNNQVLNLGSILGSTMGTIDTPLLKMESFICDSGFVKMEVLPTRWAECEQIGWFPTDPISLRITQGEEFATIFNIRTETDLGNTALIDPFVRIEDLSFFFRPNWDQDGLDDIVIMPIDSNFTLPFTVVVEASINEVTFSNEIEFIPKSLIIETGVYPEVTTTGEQSYLDIYISGLCSWLSFETKINVEIISGQEYGNLIDPYSGDKTKNINNLEHWFGFAYLDYIADGISPNLADTVIFRISTTDPDIVPKEVTLVIKPSPIYVYTIPETIGADDIADVIIQHRLEDGTLEDFPPDQTFELAVLDGCINGNFMVGDSINVYFEDALQPIKFVTSDTLDSEVKNILIRVGTNLDEGGGGGISRPIGNLGGEEIKAVDTLRVGFEKMMAEKRAAAEKKENNEPPIEAPIVKQCALDEPTYTTYWKGFTSVGDECENYPCSSIQLFPPLKIKTKPIYENVVKGLNLCYENSAGVTVFPFDNKPISPFYSDLVFDKDLFVRYEVDACFNKLANNGDGGWQFLISSEGEEHTIKLNVYIALCLDQISLTKITNKSQLESIPKDYVCAALKDFDNARPYQFSNSKLPKPKFYHIVDVTLIHEHVHKKFFEVDIKSVIEKSIYYNGKLLTYAQHFAYTPNCNNEYWELTSAISAGKNYFRDLFKKFAKDLEKESNIRSLNKYENENYTQWNTLVQDMITQYQEALIKIWKDKNLPKNESPLTNCNYTFKDKWKAFDKWRNIFEY